jgi:hypothetical protein
LRWHPAGVQADSSTQHRANGRETADFLKKTAPIRAVFDDRTDVFIFLKKGVAGIFE